MNAKNTAEEKKLLKSEGSLRKSVLLLVAKQDVLGRESGLFLKQVELL